MPFSAEDKYAIQLMRQLNSMEQWSLGGLNKLIRKIDDILVLLIGDRPQRIGLSKLLNF